MGGGGFTGEFGMSGGGYKNISLKEENRKKGNVSDLRGSVNLNASTEGGGVLRGEFKTRGQYRRLWEKKRGPL